MPSEVGPTDDVPSVNLVVVTVTGVADPNTYLTAEDLDTLTNELDKCASALLNKRGYDVVVTSVCPNMNSKGEESGS
jgi:hypothetical protein